MIYFSETTHSISLGNFQFRVLSGKVLRENTTRPEGGLEIFPANMFDLAGQMGHGIVMDYQEILLSAKLMSSVDQSRLIAELLGQSQEDYLKNTVSVSNDYFQAFSNYKVIAEVYDQSFQ